MKYNKKLQIRKEEDEIQSNSWFKTEKNCWKRNENYIIILKKQHNIKSQWQRIDHHAM